MSKLGRTFLLTLTVAAAACASAGGGGGRGTGGITGEQLIQTGEKDLYSAVSALRPMWVHARSGARMNGTAQIMLYVNNAPYGTVDDLRSIPIETVHDVSYMSASEATTRYGLAGGAVGLILVRTGG